MSQSQKRIVGALLLLMSTVFNHSANAKTLYIDMSNPVSSSTKAIVKVSLTEKSQPNELDTIIDYYANKNSIHPALIKAIIKQESSFNTQAVSPKGAQGLMQVMPETAASYGRYNLLSPKHNIDVGTRHLSYLSKRYNNLPMVLAAYNAGEGNVDKYKGIPPFAETQGYVLKVLKNYNDELDKTLLITKVAAEQPISLSVASSERLSNQQPVHNQQPGRILYLSIPR